MLRDAAYQLHLPAERAHLHALALDLLDGLVAQSPHLAGPWGEELAAHAQGARPTGDPARSAELERRQAGYLQAALDWQFNHGRTDSALRAARALTGLAACPPEVRIHALRLAGEASSMVGDLAGASKHLQRAADEAGLTTREGRAALRALGSVLMRLQQSQQGQAALETCVAASRAHDDQANLGRALGALGVLHMFSGRAESGTALLQEALAIQQRLGETMAAATSQANLGNILVQQGRADRALALFDLAEAAFQQAGALYHLALLRANRAVLHQNFGRATEALADHQAAVEGIRRAGDRASEARMRSNYGLLLADQGQTAEGERQIRMALELARETGDRQSEALAMAHLGAQYVDRPDSPQGLVLLEGALALLEAQADKRLQCVARLNLAELRLARGEIELAQQQAARAGELAGQSQDPLWGAMCRNLQARVLVMLGQTQAGLELALQAGQELEALGAHDHALAQAGAARLRALAVLGRMAEAEAIHALIRLRAQAAASSVSMRTAEARCGALLQSIRLGQGHTGGHLPAELGHALMAALAARGVRHG